VQGPFRYLLQSLSACCRAFFICHKVVFPAVNLTQCLCICCAVKPLYLLWLQLRLPVVEPLYLLWRQLCVPAVEPLYLLWRQFCLPAVKPLYLLWCEACLLLNNCQILRLELERWPRVAHCVSVPFVCQSTTEVWNKIIYLESFYSLLITSITVYTVYIHVTIAWKIQAFRKSIDKKFTKLVKGYTYCIHVYYKLWKFH